MFNCPPTQALISSLVPSEHSDAPDVSKLPVAQRMRAAYWLKHVYESADSDEAKRCSARLALERGMLHRPHGSLLRHEAAYVLGQLRDVAAQVLRL
eukprot:SAG11_NODE_2029_length_3902_cov_2.613463_2_plen_96_part_00